MALKQLGSKWSEQLDRTGIPRQVVKTLKMFIVAFLCIPKMFSQNVIKLLITAFATDSLSKQEIRQALDSQWNGKSTFGGFLHCALWYEVFLFYGFEKPLIPA